MSRAAEIRDIDKDGVDDREQTSESSEDAPTNKQEAVDRTQQGMGMFGQMVDQFMGTAQKKKDTLGRDIKMGLMGNMIGKGFDSLLTKDMADFQSGLYKDNARFGADLELRNQRDARADEFGYGMRAMDKQLEVQDEFQNREFGRDIGYMQATGEQQRKNMRATGVEDRLSRITQGEQDRLGTMATGDQQRKGLRTQGKEQRKGMRTEGRQERKGIRATGSEQRKGFKEQGRQQRQTIDFQDRINARSEDRAARRASTLARGF